MAWKLEKKLRVWSQPPFITRWDWELFFSSLGMSAGSELTKKKAERAMLVEQGRMWGRN